MANFDLSYIIKAVDNFSPALSKLQTEMDKIKVKTLSFNQGFAKMGAASFAMGRKLFTHVTLPLLAVGGYALKQSMNFEKMKLSLEAATGSAKVASNIFEDLKERSMISGISLESYTNLSSKLLLSGMNAKKLNSVLTKMSILSVGTGTDIERTASSFMKMQTKGSASVGELTSAGGAGYAVIARLKVLYEKAGYSAKKVQKILETHRISYTDIGKAIDSLTNKNSSFNKVYEKQRNTTENALQGIHSAMRIYIEDIAGAVFGVTKNQNAFAKLRDIMHKFEKPFAAWAKQHATLLKTVVVAGMIAAVLAPIVIIFGAIVTAIGLIFTPIGLVVAAIVAAGVGVIYLYNKFAIVRKIVKEIWNILKGFGKLFIHPIKTIDDWMEKLEKKYPRKHPHIRYSKMNNVSGAAAINSPSQIARSNIGMDINVRDRTKIISGIKTRTSGIDNFNLGHNTAFAGS